MSRHPRVAARWLLRYLEEVSDATIDEVALVAACLAALAEDRRQDAALPLRAMAVRDEPGAVSRHGVSKG